MQSFTLMIVWLNGQVSQTPFANRQLAMAALDDICVTATATGEKTLNTYVQAAVIVQNAPDATLETVRRSKS